MAVDVAALEGWARIAAALGVGALAPKAWDLIRKAITGRSTKERAEVDRLRVEVEEARVVRDREAARRRRWQEHASEVRRIALDAGVKSSEIPAAPNGEREPK